MFSPCNEVIEIHSLYSGFLQVGLWIAADNTSLSSFFFLVRGHDDR